MPIKSFLGRLSLQLACSNIASEFWNKSILLAPISILSLLIISERVKKQKDMEFTACLASQWRRQVLASATMPVWPLAEKCQIWNVDKKYVWLTGSAYTYGKASTSFRPYLLPPWKMAHERTPSRLGSCLHQPCPHPRRSTEPQCRQGILRHLQHQDCRVSRFSLLFCYGL